MTLTSGAMLTVAMVQLHCLLSHFGNELGLQCSFRLCCGDSIRSNSSAEHEIVLCRVSSRPLQCERVSGTHMFVGVDGMNAVAHGKEAFGSVSDR